MKVMDTVLAMEENQEDRCSFSTNVQQRSPVILTNRNIGILEETEHITGG